MKGTDAAALAAGQLRLHLAEQLNLIPKDRWEFVWLTGFPLFEWSETESRWVPAQHPFTGIVEEDLDKLEDASDAARSSIRSKGYDLVLNGVELGSGSIRIHRQDVQERVFRALGLSDAQARQRFGFFLDALKYGTPPHGGIALGLDRVVALLAGEKSIREVIAFPKTTAAQDLMADAPSPVAPEQFEELGIKIVPQVRQAPCDCGGAWRLTFGPVRLPAGAATYEPVSCPISNATSSLVVQAAGAADWQLEHQDPQTGLWSLVDSRGKAQ